MIKLNNLFGTKIGIDLGTSTTKVAGSSGAIIYAQPTVVAISKRDNIVVAVGEEAQSMIGRAPETILVVRPMKAGAIADYLITQALLQHCLRETVGKSIVKPETMICAPSASRQYIETASGMLPRPLAPGNLLTLFQNH